MELKTEASLRHAQTLLAANQFSHAVAVANSLFRLCYKYNMQVENTTILLLLAEIHKKSGNAVLGHSINRNLYNCPNLKVSANIDVVSLNAPLYEPMTLPVNVLSNTVASTSAAGDVVLAGGVFPARYDVNASAVPETSKSGGFCQLSILYYS